MATLHLVNPPLKGATALQRALVAAGLLTQADVDDQYGPHTAGAVETAKFRLGYPDAQLHPGAEVADDTLLAYLRGKKKLPPDFVERRRKRLGLDGGDASTPSAGEQGEMALRAATVAAFRWLIAHEPQIHYKQSRPVPVTIPKLTLPPGGITTDCSGAILLACKWGGLPDPNGLGYSGQGFTGTLLSNLRHITRPMVRPADIVVFGPGNGEHACMVLAVPAGGGDLEVGSHGQEKGPVSVPLASQIKYHNPPTIFLRAPLPAP